MLIFGEPVVKVPIAADVIFVLVNNFAIFFIWSELIGFAVAITLHREYNKYQLVNI